MTSRRAFLQLTAASSALLLGACGVPRRPQTVPATGTSFGAALPVPQLAPTRRDGDVTVFELSAQHGRTVLAGPGPATTCGYNGSYLGPTLRARRGDRVRVEVRNDLDAATTVHWHGMRLPAEFDGGPHQTIPAGGAWSPEWTIDQPAATLWYHPHPHGATEEQVMAGLAGLFLVDDDAAPDELPSEYGLDDVPIVLQDRSFDAGGEFVTTRRANTGYVGDVVLVNGAVRPVLEVPRGRIRLRILNGSPARVYHLAFDGDRPFDLVATDGGLLPYAARLDRLLLSPGERAEIVVQVGAGDRCALSTVPVDLGFYVDSDAANAGVQDTVALLQLVGTGSASQPALTARLAPDITPPATTGPDREFVLNGETINNRFMDLQRVDLVLPAGAVERWTVRTTGDRPHNFHVHDAQFVVESVDGGPPPLHLRGWKDTVLLPVTSAVVLRVPVGQHTSETAPYMYHCHLLWHEDQGMMGQFLVVEPGREHAVAPTIDHAAPGHGH